MQFLTEKTGQDNFVLLGLCSGAYKAHKLAVKDNRIVGAVFMDGIVFRTAGFFLRHHVARLFKPRFWRNAVKRRFVQQPSEKDAAAEKLARTEFFSNDEFTQDQVIRDLKNLLQRDVQLLFLYTDGYDDICGRTQFKEMYGLCPDDGQLQVEYYEKSEHTFRLIENRRVTCERVANWFESRFGMEAACHSNLPETGPPMLSETADSSAINAFLTASAMAIRIEHFQYCCSLSCLQPGNAAA